MNFGLLEYHETNTPAVHLHAILFHGNNTKSLLQKLKDLAVLDYS